MEAWKAEAEESANESLGTSGLPLGLSKERAATARPSLFITQGLFAGSPWMMLARRCIMRTLDTKPALAVGACGEMEAALWRGWACSLPRGSFGAGKSRPLSLQHPRSQRLPLAGSNPPSGATCGQGWKDRTAGAHVSRHFFEGEFPP